MEQQPLDANNQNIWTKKVLTMKEAVILTGFKKSYLYILTSTNQIPHSKPTGRTLFFEREKLENWMLGNPIKTVQEIDQEVANRIAKKPFGAKRKS